METQSQIAAKVNDFFSRYPLKRYGKGELIILSGEEPKHVYYIVKGHVREYDISPSGDEVVVNVFKPPAFFPMSWAINKSSNEYFFEAGSVVEAHATPPEDAVKFIKQNPDVMFDLLSRLYRGTDGLLRRMAHLMGSTARKRVLFELVIENRRFGKSSSPNSSTVKISESELGARAGLSRETVSREIKELKKNNLISISQSGITIPKIDLLEKELGENL